MGEQEWPRVLVDAFDGDRRLMKWTEALSPSMRREIAQWVIEPKSESTRRARAEHLAERFLSTIEAERELPGFIRQALNDAAAIMGWRSMTPLQQRMLLLAVFRPKGLEGRERQVQRLLEAALQRGNLDGKRRQNHE